MTHRHLDYILYLRSVGLKLLWASESPRGFIKVHYCPNPRISDPLGLRQVWEATLLTSVPVLQMLPGQGPLVK
jgi:hypothetical protein